MKVALYCPKESTIPALRTVVKMQHLPAPGDFLYCCELAPPKGPGSSDFVFRVVSRSFTCDEVELTLAHVFEHP